MRPDGKGLAGTALTGALAAWFGVTVLSQHPHQIFDRFRRYDLTGLVIANWRFFAPEPAQHDFHVLHRVLTADGDQTSWSETTRIPRRRLVQALWFPDRRQDKAMFDVCNELIIYLARKDFDITTTAAYQVLRDSVELAVRGEHPVTPKGFQFVIARATGYDDTPEPEYLLVSQFVSLEEEA
ncbi:hypothetical protein [Alloactinosynnema sp. L-07]|uniref:hypothetical protein n=1 Tax=Alloactinosynnema sp. L-07 TaxID=1653480 RepID=UPI00065F08B8|nr:hypothetical protein [Alloactinosynnema sp. L-07]CRK56202.1 hypothetical protein [Alloactinosynnema sp. L-07]